jgi:hypothetical protein
LRLAALLVVALTGCGWFVRDRVRTIEVVVEKPTRCLDIDPPDAVPLVEGGTSTCPDGYDFCMEAAGSAALAKLYEWAMGAWIHCGPAPRDAGP